MKYVLRLVLIGIAISLTCEVTANYRSTGDLDEFTGRIKVDAKKVDAKKVDAKKPSVSKTAKADIILLGYTVHTDDNSSKVSTTFPSGRQIFISGDAEIDGKTFRDGIKGSRQTEGNPGGDRVVIQVPSKSTRVLVSHYRFVLQELPGANADTGRPPAMRWVGTQSGFSVLYEMPENIDNANSGVAELIKPGD